MFEIPSNQLFNIVLFLLVPFLCGYLLKRYNLPVIIGYIVGGILMTTLSFSEVSLVVIQQFASFGIMLLMFTLGLEINFDRLYVQRKIIVVAGVLQIILTSLIIFIVSMLFHFTPLQSFLIGIAFSSSSTTLVAKIIQDRGEETSFVGELAIGILMFQDLAFIPILIIFTYLQSSVTSYTNLVKDIGWTMLQTTLIVLFMYYVGKRVAPFMFHKIARSSRELLNLFIIVFVFVVAFASALIGLPILIGVFIAGAVVSQTLEHFHIFSQVRPIRDILGIIFFVYIGTHLNLATVSNSIPQILLFTAVILAAKFMILIFIFVYLKLHSRASFHLSSYLFQLSENAFLLLSISYANGILTHDQLVSLTASVLLSIIITPLLTNNKDLFYLYVRTFFKRYVPAVEMFVRHSIDHSYLSLETSRRESHIIICGYGRIGSYVGRALMLADIPFVAVDYNYQIVAGARKEGVDIIYGDPTDADILKSLQIEHAVALVSCLPDIYSQEHIVINVKKINSKILLLSNVHKREYVQRIKDLGADVVIQSEYEASLSIIKKLFAVKELPKQDIINKVRHFKLEQGMGI
ncbi:MAG: hypothetical protein RI947_945 [Candidatus Parcubacteria bacterium]|jgi:CPA2 family monovalent cation:H+ antiporter-2